MISKYKFLIPSIVAALAVHLWNLGLHEVQGDEASALLAALKTSMGVYNPKMFGNIFLYGHAPVRALLNFPAILIGHYSEFLFRLPNALLGALTVIPIYLICLKTTKNEKLSALSSLAFAVSGVAFGNRLAMGVGPFVFGHTFGLYFLLNYLTSGSRKDFGFFGLSMTLAILSYVEGILFFFPMIGILLLKKRNLIQEVRYNFLSVLSFGGVIFSFLGLWFGLPLFLKKKGIVDTINDKGGWRILNRISDVESNNFVHNFNMLESYIGLIAIFAISATTLIFFYKVFNQIKEKEFNNTELFILIWGGTPLFYFFFLVANPTNHITFYFSYLVIWSSVGAHKSDSLFKYSSFALTTPLILGMLFTTVQISNHKRFVEWGPQKESGLRELGFFVRENFPKVREVYTDQEGYIVRYYLGTGTTENIKEASVAILKDTNKVLENGWSLAARINCNDQDLGLYVKNSVSNVTDLICKKNAQKLVKKYSSLKMALPQFWEKHVGR